MIEGGVVCAPSGRMQVSIFFTGVNWRKGFDSAVLSGFVVILARQRVDFLYTLPCWSRRLAEVKKLTD
ncbi:hypothetical protein [Chromatium okenii]|uniref:Uncharacterized protein n=1 Tax=Chromatium okenii TaxID=61644 RepID=A0A2S7XSB2_9GAMM|nr:hypothetical protein [Chromatium okenii]PQJ96348.1 hypothetical protein CXB77_11490 [Chromatium okenii]